VGSADGTPGRHGWDGSDKPELRGFGRNGIQKGIGLGVDYVDATGSLSEGPVRQVELLAGIDPGNVKASEPSRNGNRGYLFIDRGGSLRMRNHKQPRPRN